MVGAGKGEGYELYSRAGRSPTALRGTPTVTGFACWCATHATSAHARWRCLRCWTDGHIVRFAPALARGLSYYTGAIFEVKIRGAQMGSVCGGGRYDNLTGIFGLEGVSGVGISFGIDRICDVMKERGLLPTEETGIDILLVHDSYNELSRLMAIAHQLRSADFNTLVLPDPMLLKKHMEYANKHHIPFVGWIYENTRLKLRNMKTGEEHEATPQETIAWLSAQQQN